MKKFLSFLLLLVLVLGSEFAFGNVSGIIENRESLQIQKSSAISIKDVPTVSETSGIDKQSLNKELQEVEITRSTDDANTDTQEENTGSEEE